MIQLTTTGEQPIIDRDRFVHFLESFAPFSRKTLGAIQTMLHKRFAIKVRSAHDEETKAPLCHDKIIDFVIPEALQKKRLEELSWEDMTTLCT